MTTVIMYSRDTLTLENVISTLRSRDAKLNWKKAAEKETKNDEALMIRGRQLRRGNLRFRDQSKFRNNSRPRGNTRSKSRPKETRKCHHCGKIVNDHYSSYGDVFIIIKEQGEASNSGDACTSLDHKDNDEWILDSGCTYHMSPNKDWFIDYSKIDGGKVMMGNDQKCQVIGIGTIAIRSYDGTIKTLRNGASRVKTPGGNQYFLSVIDDYSRKTGNTLKLEGFVDANYASNKDTKKSITSYCFQLTSCCINWKSQLQHVVALSTTEAEFMAITEAFKEATWIKGILQEISMLKGKVSVFLDSQSAIHLSKNLIYHGRSKHIDIRMFWIRDKIESGEIELEKVPSDENPADAGTKVLPVSKFKYFMDLLKLGPV
uniref:Retrovirus-related Pol polyprotein from transposon TNT 1-94-like beta-barrel domain-containing protein n=1 Tax=Cannabis sativa TaxID=3483 RepID=A0A803PXN5_CANSA